MQIDKGEIEFLPLSMLDDFGRVFAWNGKIYRAIRSEKHEFVRTLFACGLIARLMESGFFVGSRMTDHSLEGYALVIAHDTAEVVTYPHEWSYEMLKQAALAVLKVNEVAAGFGFQTKDCHPYNVLFFGSSPKYIDFGSFIPVAASSREQLFAFEEFAKCYSFPLTIWERGDEFTARRYVQRWKQMATPDAYLAYRLGGTGGLLRRIIRKAWKTHFKLQRMARELADPASTPEARMRDVLARIAVMLKFPLRTSHIRTQLQRLQKSRRHKSGSQWSGYHEMLYVTNGQLALSGRMQRIIGIVAGLSPATVTDIAGNQGVVSQAVAGLPGVERVTCLDYDSEAIDRGFQRIRAMPVASKLNFAVLDPFYPEINRLETPPETRFHSEMVLALAVTHHLILTQGYPLEHIFASVRRYAKRYVAIEFMPLGLFDSISGNGVPPPAWYTEDWFRAEFLRHFRLIEVYALEVNRVLFLGACEPVNAGARNASWHMREFCEQP